MKMKLNLLSQSQIVVIVILLRILEKRMKVSLGFSPFYSKFTIFVYFFQVFVQKMIEILTLKMMKMMKYLIKPEKYFWIPV